MRHIHFLFAAFLLVVPAQAQAQQQQQAQQQSNLCPFVKTAQINVVPRAKQVKYDTSKTLAELQAQELDTINPYGFSGVSTTQGFASTEINSSSQVKLGHKVYQEAGAVCLWYDRIDVTLEIDSTITIGKEVYADSCLRPVTVEHEMKHVNVDRQIVNKYAKIIGQKIYAALQERGFRAQPVPIDHAQAMADRMQTLIGQVVEFEFKKMDLERTEAQLKVDSIEEYDRLSKLCPESRAKMQPWASSKQHSSQQKPAAQVKTPPVYRPR